MVQDPNHGDRFELDVVHSNPPLTPELAGELHPHVSLKFRVAQVEGALKLGFFGHLTAIRAAALYRQIELAVARCITRPLPVFIDASGLRTSPDDALGDFRRALAVLNQAGTTIGVVLGPPSIATSQLMRLLREAELADGLVFAVNAAEAVAVWNSICRELCGPASGIPTFTPESITAKLGMV